MADDDTTGTAGGKTFTQAEVDAIVRDRLKREREATATKYADYDALKTAAAEGDKNKTQLDKVSEQLAALTERAEKAEVAKLRSDIIAAKKIPPSLAKRLQGKTEEELNADADELLSDWKAAGGRVDGDEGGNEQEGDEGKATTTARPAARTGRPREDLRSGAPVTAREPEETNPLKLAALIPRG
jgi:hypothetical protein